MFLYWFSIFINLPICVLSSHFTDRILNQRVLELDAQIEDLQESQTKSAVADSASGTEMRQTVTTLREQKEKLESELNKYKQTIDDLENKVQCDHWLFTIEIL